MYWHELHGRHYYMELTSQYEVRKTMEYISEEKAFDNDEFYVSESEKHSFYLWSLAKAGEFRGEKYSAWERVKRKTYKLKRRERLIRDIVNKFA